MVIVEHLRRVSVKRLLGQHAAFHLGKLGFYKTFAAFALKFGAKRAAVGVATTGLTGLTVKYQYDDAQRRSLDNEVLSSGDELAALNAAVKPVWDHLNAGLRRVIVEEFTPALQRRVPYVGRYLHFRRLTLGDQAPRLGPVTVTQSAHGVDMQVGFAFAGDLAIEFSAGVASLEVADLQINGVVQVSLRPLVDELNPVGGVTISCLDRPQIDLKIRAGSELVPNLYDFVRETVDDVIADIIVAPNGIAVPIPTLGEHEADFPALRYPVPKGLLRLKVLRLDGLPGSSTSSPYVQALVGAHSWRSPTARAEAALEEAEEDAADGEAALAAFQWASGNLQDFLVFSENQSVELRVFSSGTFSVDGLLGRARLPLRSVLGERVEVALQGADGGPSRASIALSAAWLAVAEGDERRSEQPGLAPSAAAAAGGDDVFGALPTSGSTHRFDSLSSLAQEPESLLSVRVDEVSGIQADGPRPPRFSVRASASGRSAETGMGEAPAEPLRHLDDQTFLVLARRLAPHMKAEALAQSLDISAFHASELLEQGADREDAEWASAWCHRARAAARTEAAARRPQFGHVMHVPLLRPEELVLELVRHAEGASKTHVVGSLSQDLGDVVSQGGALEGPFRMVLADGSECRVEGSVRVRRLEPEA